MEERYQRRNGYEADCDVIYGDTDSVMVHFRVKDIGRAMELGREAAEFVSKTFVKPIKLEFEKVSSCTQSGVTLCPITTSVSLVLDHRIAIIFIGNCNF